MLTYLGTFSFIIYLFLLLLSRGLSGLFREKCDLRDFSDLHFRRILLFLPSARFCPQWARARHNADRDEPNSFQRRVSPTVRRFQRHLTPTLWCHKSLGHTVRPLPFKKNKQTNKNILINHNSIYFNFIWVWIFYFHDKPYYPISIYRSRYRIK